MGRIQVTCQCNAYSFPHRFGGGSCNGLPLVEYCWENRISCYHCTLNNNGCEVVKGQESVKECPYVIEFCNYNEVKLK